MFYSRIFVQLLASEEHVDLFSNGLKVPEMIAFPNRRNLHNYNIKNGSIIVNVTMVFNEYLELPHVSMGDDALSEA